MDLEKRAEARAAEARGYIDDLAARLGSAPEVRQNTLADCSPGLDESALDLIYTIHVPIEPGTAERLSGEIADHFEAAGWTVKRDPESNGVVSVRFAKDTFTMGAKVSEENSLATVGGSGGCVQ